MNAVAAEAMIERAGRALINAASAPAKVILFGSHARGDANDGSDFDFLVIERQVDDRLAEAVKLRHALRGFGVPVDVIVMDEGLVERRSKVKGTMVAWLRVTSMPAASLPTTPRLTTTSSASTHNRPSRRRSR
jgi:predicted nucleotidyltransferase